MAASTSRFGMEDRQDERYRLSFTVGGLLLDQGRAVASYFLDHATERARAEAQSSFQMGAAIASIRAGALEDNVLALRSATANARYMSEVIKRLSALSYGELVFLTSTESVPSDRRLVMWIAMCRDYAFVGDFATEVLRRHFLVREPLVTFEDFARFVRSKTLWHPELGSVTAMTLRKLRTNLFSAMGEAELLERPAGRVVGAPVTASLSPILERRPDSLEFLPTDYRVAGRMLD